MSPVTVSAHNPMTGPRHLGHYVSTMVDWPRLQRQQELFILIDDVIACILYPNARKEVEERTFQVAKEFLSMDLNPDKSRIALTSMIPEAFELALFASLAIDGRWCDQLYDESFAGLVDTLQRRELGLPRYGSVAERVYPQIHLASLTLGLRANFFQGGEEMLGYMPIMEAISLETRLRRRLQVPKFLKGRSTFLLGNDGQHMVNENAIFLSSPLSELERDVKKVESIEVLNHWCEALGRKFINPKTIKNDEDTLAKARRTVTDMLAGDLKRFRDSRIGTAKVVKALEAGSLAARSRIKGTLMEIKESLGIPGFV